MSKRRKWHAHSNDCLTARCSAINRDDELLFAVPPRLKVHVVSSEEYTALSASDGRSVNERISQCVSVGTFLLNAFDEVYTMLRIMCHWRVIAGKRYHSGKGNWSLSGHVMCL
jgi:hypothetical protein